MISYFIFGVCLVSVLVRGVVFGFYSKIRNYDVRLGESLEGGLVFLGS